VRRIAWIHPDQSKTQKAITIPLNQAAQEILRRQIGGHDRYVFTYLGEPVKDCNTKAWKAALKRAGIEGFRWHDLRHTWASWHVQAGTPLNVLQELGGWASFEMLLRYAHLSAEHLERYAGNVIGLPMADSFKSRSNSN
jgi:integrase